jgi:hypothetical protein
MPTRPYWSDLVRLRTLRTQNSQIDLGMPMANQRSCVLKNDRHLNWFSLLNNRLWPLADIRRCGLQFVLGAKQTGLKMSFRRATGSNVIHWRTVDWQQLPSPITAPSSGAR